jgi:orotidine-5'-phosphate decarboxylase
MTSAEKLEAAIRRTGCAISAGIEPAPDYLPPEGFEPNPAGYLAFFRLFVEATQDLVAAYKFNLAFFESQGIEGTRLLHRLRELIPEHSVVIMDAKRGDIGTTAKHYAKSIYEGLAADCTTVNPLMGRDSAEPFLEYQDRLTYFLALTSNPGAEDFLQPEKLYLRIAERVQAWGTCGQAGLVVGATNGVDEIEEIRRVAPDLPFLVPGLGAQGGDAAVVCRAGAIRGSAPRSMSGFAQTGLLLHSTRGLLPTASDAGKDVSRVIREKAIRFAAHLNESLERDGTAALKSEGAKS